MTNDELTAALEERQAIVVHFSHHSNMRSGGVFPNDLKEAIRNKDNWNLSCSVLWPGHKVQPCGSVGVIFKPTVASVLSVSNSDSGSYQAPNGTDCSLGAALDINTFEATFQVAGAYNEWRVRGADVLGIFVLDIYSVDVKKEMQISAPNGTSWSEISTVRIGLAEVLDTFDDLPVYTMTPSGLIRVDRMWLSGDCSYAAEVLALL